MSNQKKKDLFGLYDDEQILLKSIRKAKQENLDIHDVISPFPVHGLNEELGLAESRLHVAVFLFGSVGFLLAFFGMSWIFTKDWPLIIGGKPFWSVPGFIPITFEVTVLLSAVGMVVVFYMINGLRPQIKTEVLHPRLTDDRFAIIFDTSESTNEEMDQLENFFEATGAEEVQMKEAINI